MGRNHLKRIAMPKSWPIKRKGITYVLRANPGAHKMEDSMPLGVIIRDMLGFAKTAREARFILNKSEVLVNSKKTNNPSLAVGFMDVISFPKKNECFRIVYDENGFLKMLKIKDAEKNLMVCKITKKNKVSGGKTQFTMNNGRTITSAKDSYKIGDSLLMELPGQKVKDHFKLEKGCPIYISKGKQKGITFTLKEIKEDKIIFEHKKKDYTTLKEYAFVIGKDKPVIEVM